MQEILKSFEGAKEAYKALDDKKGIDITVLDISEVSTLADYFIIASGSNPNHLRAMADEAEEKLFKCGFKIRHYEGLQSGGWILLDFGDLVIHLFNEEEREFYNIERIWGDAKFVSEEDLKK